MRAIRIHTAKGKPVALLLPENLCEKIALWCRGYRYAPHVMSSVPWWKKKRRPEDQK